MSEHDASRQATQVLDERDAQHDRDRPDFADGEGRYVLVSVDELEQALFIETSIRMGDQAGDRIVDAGVMLILPFKENRQFCTIVRGEVRAYRENLLFDEIVVVEQPFTGRRDRVLLTNGLGQLAVVRGEIGSGAFDLAGERGDVGDAFDAPDLFGCDLARTLSKPICGQAVRHGTEPIFRIQFPRLAEPTGDHPLSVLAPFLPGILGRVLACVRCGGFYTLRIIPDLGKEGAGSCELDTPMGIITQTHL